MEVGRERTLPVRFKGAVADNEVEATEMGQEIVACTPVVEAYGMGKEIMFCKPRELVAKEVKVCTPLAVLIETKGPEVAKVWVELVEPPKEIRAAVSQVAGLIPLTVVKVGVVVAVRVAKVVVVATLIRLLAEVTL